MNALLFMKQSTEHFKWIHLHWFKRVSSNMFQLDQCALDTLQYASYEGVKVLGGQFG